MKSFADNKETKLVMVYIMILQLIVNTFTSQLVIIQAPHKVAVPGDLVCTDLQWRALENQQSPFCVVNRDSLSQNYIL